MYKNVLNQRMVALFLWLSSYLSYTPAKKHPANTIFHRSRLKVSRYLSQFLVNGILNNPLI